MLSDAGPATVMALDFKMALLLALAPQMAFEEQTNSWCGMACLTPIWSLLSMWQMLNGHAVTGVAAGDHTLVSLSSGEIVGCGSNHNGQLGLGHTIQTADLQTLPLDSMRADVRAGAFHTFVSYGGIHPRRARNASAAAAVSSLCRIS